jgi:hypothetical protein
MSNRNPSELFGAHYFAHSCGLPYERNEHWLNFFGGIAEHIQKQIQPQTVLDAGCAMGFLVEKLRALDIQAWGVDISAYAIAQVHPSIQPYCWVGSVTDPFPREYDLIVSIEVLEHMPKADSERALANLCRHTDDILFSSTPLDYKEATHFNVQPPEYWAELFARQGFFRDVDFDASFITPWAARFRRSSEPPHRLAREYERKFWLLWKENRDLRELVGEMREKLANAERQLAEEEVQPLRARLEAIQNSRSWRVLKKLQRIIPTSPPKHFPREKPFREVDTGAKD